MTTVLVHLTIWLIVELRDRYVLELTALHSFFSPSMVCQIGDVDVFIKTLDLPDRVFCDLPDNSMTTFPLFLGISELLIRKLLKHH